MNINKLSIAVLLVVAAMSSCTNDNELNSNKFEYLNSVRVTVEDFLPETSGTRTAYTVDGSGFHFQWADGDALGIYPVGGDQVKFPISSGDGSASAAFDGGAWKLRSEYQYAAYYPFSANNYTISERALPVSYTGQSQNGNGSTAHLGAYDYLACAATAPDVSGGVDLTMKHLGAFVRLQLTMPKADTFSSVVLESDGTKFVTAGTFDLTAATPAITPTATSSTYTINLTNVATTEKNQMITVYAMVAPANLSNNNISVTVHGTGQTTYVQTVPGKNFVARSAYNIAVDNFPSGTNASGEDVSWEESAFVPEAVDLGLSVKWATCNIGATTPEGYGDYFAWGETEPKASYSGKTYKFGYYLDGKLFFNKYNNSSIWGAIDNKETLDLADDAAHINWDGSWRMPTEQEIRELRSFSNCSWTITTINGIQGRKVTSKINGNSIFLPNTGYKEYGEFYSGSGGYWSSSLMALYTDYAWTIFFDDEEYIIHYFRRWEGHPIRAVCP